MNSQSKPLMGISPDRDWYVSPQPWLSMDNHLRPSAGLPTNKDPYVTHVASQPWWTRPIEHRELSSQHGFYGALATIETIDPVRLDADHQYMLAPRDPHHFLESRGPYVADDFGDMRGSFLR